MTIHQIEKALLALSPADRLKIFQKVVLRGEKPTRSTRAVPPGERVYIEWKTVKRNSKEYGPYAYEVTETHEGGKRQRKRKYLGKNPPVATVSPEGRIEAMIEQDDQAVADAILNAMKNYKGVKRERPNRVIEH